MDGVDLAESFGGKPRRRGIPLLLIFRTSAENIDRGVEQGADGFLAKA